MGQQGLDDARPQPPQRPGPGQRPPRERGPGGQPMADDKMPLYGFRVVCEIVSD